MKLSPVTLDRLKLRIIGDTGTFPRLNGPTIITLFQDVGIKEIYDFSNGGMPGALSRKDYTFSKLKELNNSISIQTLIENIASPAHFLGSGLNHLEAISELNTILKEDNYELFEVNGQWKVNGAIKAEIPSVEAHFEENRSKIISEIRKAKYLIWVAVAWLTDRVLLTELKVKKLEGLNIQIVTQDDEINYHLKSAVIQVFEAYYKKPKGEYKNLMHHKFCIIDLKTVVHGSYNWTIKAQYNDETVTITHSTEFAHEFANTFMSLKNSGTI